MTETKKPGIYLFIHFNWPAEISPELAKAARALHDEVVAADWIEEAVAASGGIGSGPSSVWVFHLRNYAALDRLLTDTEDPVAEAYRNCFSQMQDVSEEVREGVAFL